MSEPEESVAINRFYLKQGWTEIPQKALHQIRRVSLFALRVTLVAAHISKWLHKTPMWISGWCDSTQEVREVNHGRTGGEAWRVGVCPWGRIQSHWLMFLLRWPTAFSFNGCTFKTHQHPPPLPLCTHTHLRLFPLRGCNAITCKAFACLCVRVCVLRHECESPNNDY